MRLLVGGIMMDVRNETVASLYLVVVVVVSGIETESVIQAYKRTGFIITC
jgi:hypothetical protein